MTTTSGSMSALLADCTLAFGDEKDNTGILLVCYLVVSFSVLELNRRRVLPGTNAAQIDFMSNALLKVAKSLLDMQGGIGVGSTGV